MVFVVSGELRVITSSGYVYSRWRSLLKYLCRYTQIKLISNIPKYTNRYADIYVYILESKCYLKK